MNLLIIILAAAYTIISVLFLREIINPKTIEIVFSTYVMKRAYIAEKYVPFYGILIFLTFLVFYLNLTI